MTEKDNREEKIQAAMKNAESKWDELYTQDDWTPEEIPTTGKLPTNKRVGKGYASKAMKNVW